MMAVVVFKFEVSQCNTFLLGRLSSLFLYLKTNLDYIAQSMYEMNYIGKNNI